MDIRSNAILFPSHRGGPNSGSATFTYAREVLRAVAAISGYSATFENHHDHHLGKLDMSLETMIDPSDARKVNVAATFGLRDWSGNFDDSYSGTIDIAVFAELVPIKPPGPGESRGDLVITDAEITQGIQHFRSAKHLDSANVFPDNSIRLVASKSTGIRVWVDYDATSGLPVIPKLTGALTVSGPIPRLLLPLNKIVPRRETQLNRALTDDTLNFVLPDDVCRGDVTISILVRDETDFTQFSATFEKTLHFELMPVVRVFDVGINYTGPDTFPGQPTSAPDFTAFVGMFRSTAKLYPISQVAQTGFMTMDYDKEIRSSILKKDCDHFKELREALNDLRGDSTDIFYGLLNDGVDTGTVGGCGGRGGTAVSRISTSIPAHEIGHVFGRQHAPCDNVTRCDRPQNTDDNYPDYSGYDSDSIGEYGFDTATAMILDPGNAHDLMGYSDNDWISPYTYKALMTRIPIDNGGVASGPSASLRGVGESIRSLSPHLFVSLTIQRDRTIQWRPAFHFPAFPQQLYGKRTDYLIEQRNAAGEIQFSEFLYEDRAGCGCSGSDCIWPKYFWQGIPYDPQARLLVVLECEKPLMERHIPEPPHVVLTCKGADDRNASHISCTWTASSSEDGTLWFLLQWQDGNGVWRGVAPRTTKSSWMVPKSLWKRERVASIRVLATSDIATGVDTCTSPLARPKPGRTRGFRKVQIQIEGIRESKDRRIPLPPIIEASVWSGDGPVSARSQVQWFSGRGGQRLSPGRTLQLNTLPFGIHPVWAAVVDRGDGEGIRMFVIERTRDEKYFLRKGTASDSDEPRRTYADR